MRTLSVEHPTGITLVFTYQNFAFSFMHGMYYNDAMNMWL